MAKVSIITTVYNCEKHIAEAVQSILNQTLLDFESIILDDGSTDKTWAILKEFNNKKLRLFHSRRLGRAQALNRAIAEAKGQYIAILDADDIAFPQRLSIQKEYLDEHPHIGVVGSGRRVIIDSLSRVVGEEDTQCYTDAEIRSTLATKNPLFHSSVMYRKELLEQINGYDKKLPCLLDWDLYIRMAPHTRFSNLKVPLSYKRKHDSQFFGGEDGVFKSKQYSKARAIIAYRAVKYLNAPRRYLVKSIILYLKAFFRSGQFRPREMIRSK